MFCALTKPICLRNPTLQIVSGHWLVCNTSDEIVVVPWVWIQFQVRWLSKIDYAFLKSCLLIKERIWSQFFPFRVDTKGNNLLQTGSKFFLFRVDHHFSEEAGCIRGMLRSGFFFCFRKKCVSKKVARWIITGVIWEAFTPTDDRRRTKMNGSTSVQVTKPSYWLQIVSGHWFPFHRMRSLMLMYRHGCTFRWGDCQKWFSFFWKVIYSKREEFASSGSVFFPFRVVTKENNLLQLRVNSFFLELIITFQKRLDI